MIYSVELRLSVSRVGERPEATGYHLYAFFLHLIERTDPRLAARLHDGEGPKPFTISPLGPGDPRVRRVELREGAGARLRLTCLQEEVFASLVDGVCRLPAGESLPLGSVWVTCDSLATTPAQSPWALFTSFSELLESAGEERKLSLVFLSPTTFRTKGKRNVLLPEPALVFGSPLARWNAFAPSGLNLRLEEALASRVRLSAYRLSTRMLDFGSYQEAGFCGQAEYELDQSLPQAQVRALQALGAFAFFGGVGAKTTMGMGQTRRVDNQPARKGGSLNLAESPR